MFTVDASEMFALAASMEAAAAGLDAKASAALAKTAYDVEAWTKSEIIGMGAVDTGAMLNSVSTAIISDNEAEIGPTVDYAVYVHDGTSVVAPRPFMQRPFEMASEQLAAVYEQLAGDIL